MPTDACMQSGKLLPENENGGEKKFSRQKELLETKKDLTCLVRSILYFLDFGAGFSLVTSWKFLFVFFVFSNICHSFAYFFLSSKKKSILFYNFVS